jgi:hypothetical protein
MTSDRVRAAAVYAGALACAIVLLVPWEPPSSGGRADVAWELVVHDAAARHLQFGEQFVFNYGPYGFAYCGYDPRTFGAALAVWLFIALAFAAGTLEIARDALPSAIPRAAFVIVLALFLATQLTNNVVFLALAAVLVRLHQVRSGGWAEHLVTVGLALGALVKFSFFTAALGVVVAIAVADATRRRLSLLPLTFSAFLLAFWMAARQPVALLPRFIGRSFDLGGGYGEAMSVWYPYVSDRVELVAFLLFAAALLAWTAHRSWRHALALLPLVFVAFKAGFTRQDGHDIDAIAVLALAVYVDLPPRHDRVRWSAFAAAASLLLVVVLVSRGFGDIPARLVRAVRDQAGQFAHLVTHGTDRIARQRAELLARYRASLSERPVGTSFDVYPGDSGVLMAWQLPAARRPVFHATSAYTEALLALNAAHLRGADAPSTLLFQIVPLDRRFPTLEDAPSWREILRLYEPVSRNGDYEVLRRRAVPVAMPVVGRTMLAARFGQPLVVPDGDADLVFARIDLRYTAAGRLMRAAYMTPPLYATVHVAGERPRRFRIIPAHLRAGFLLSPLVRTGDDFARLGGPGRTTLPRVAEVEIERPLFPWMFEETFGVALEQVNYQ